MIMKVREFWRKLYKGVSQCEACQTQGLTRRWTHYAQHRHTLRLVVLTKVMKNKASLDPNPLTLHNCPAWAFSTPATLLLLPESVLSYYRAKLNVFC